MKASRKQQLIVGNWKMNLDIEQASGYATKLKAGLSATKDVEIVICPPFIDISSVSGILKGSAIAVGAQNVASEEKGAFTGEISALMLRGLVKYVIVGHSERRRIFHERDREIAAKVAQVVRQGMKPILAIGESLEDRHSGQVVSVLTSQLETGLSELTHDEIRDVVIAYEPVWAIGTGLSDTPADATKRADDIRGHIKSIYGQEISTGVRILYGGSVDSKTVAKFLTAPGIDGVLVGGASVSVDEWIKICEQAGVKVVKGAKNDKSK